ncbi:hypothetical protein HK102_003480 [Quaeritorhiza haematococci]|nr:hypothetical protein HK102_003480 [Quaeritorhiza haematococci]
MANIARYLLIFIVSCIFGISARQVTIRGYGYNGKILFSVPPNGLYLDADWKQVKYIEVGNGSKVIHAWVPWNYGNVPDAPPFVFATALADVVDKNPDIRAKIAIPGWEFVAREPICNGTDNGVLPCPDLIVLGTTQIAARFYKGELEPLDQYFSDYTEQSGFVIVDDFYKGTYYDYQIKGHWYGVPLTTDLLALYYNKALFKNLGLDEPPPVGTWDPTKPWNWDRLLEYATIIRRSTRSPAFRITSNFNDEINMMMTTLARFVNVLLVNANGTCGLRNQRWYNAVEKYIRQPLKSGLATYDIDLAHLRRSNATKALKFLNDTNPISDVVSEVDALEEMYSAANFDCPKFDGFGITSIGCIFGNLAWGQKEIGYGFPPGHFTFLGGSGLVIPKYSKNKQIAWKMMTRFIDQTTSYVGRMNTQGAPPPFKSFGEWDVFKSSEFMRFTKGLMKRAIPVQYPSTPYTQWDALERLKPFRMMLLEMVYKNFTTEVATERVCQLIDYLFARECEELDYDIHISECYPNNTKTLSYVWKTPSTCKIGTVTLPPPIGNIDCSYVVSTSPEALGMSAITALGTVASVIYSFGFMWYRNKTAVKTASIEFCLIIFLGSILMYAFVILETGPPSKAICIARPWFLAFGFGTFFGGFLVKTMRIDMIFSSTKTGRLIDPKQLSRSSMLQKFVIVLLFEFIPLVALSVIGTPGLQETTITLRGLGSYTQQDCQPFNEIPVVILLAYNASLIVYGSYIAWRSRNVPDAYNESRFVMVAVLLISFTAVVIIPVTLVLTDARTLYVLQALAVNFATTISVGIFAGPKLWAAYKNISPRKSDFHGSNFKMTLETGGKQRVENIQKAVPPRSSVASNTSKISGRRKAEF